MEHKRRNLIILAAVILLAVILLLIFWPRGEEIKPDIQNETAAVETPTEEVSLVAPLVERSAPSPTQANAEAVARSFAERFASFSYESHFANIRDLYPLMTDSYQARQEAYIKSTPVSDEYYGISSKLISLDVSEMTSSSAVMDAHLQRVESKGSAVNAVKKYETLRLNLAFENGTWLVDGTNWVK